MDSMEDIFDSNFNYERKPEKKSKGGRLRALRRMTQNAAKIAGDMTRLVTGQDLLNKAIKPATDNAVFVPEVSGAKGDNKQTYSKPRIENYVFEKDAIMNTEGQILLYPSQGMMKTLISKGQHALEQSDGNFSTFSFKGWKIKTEGVFKKVRDGTFHLLGLTNDGYWLLEASIVEIFTMNSKNEVESFGAKVELEKLHCMAKGCPVSWAAATGTLRLGEDDFTHVTADNTEPWNDHFALDVAGLTQIKQEIIINNFDERLTNCSSTYTLTWAADNRVKKIEVSSSSEEEELSECYEYVMEDLPQETAVFGPSRPLKAENLDGTGIRLAKNYNSSGSDEYQ